MRDVAVKIRLLPIGLLWLAFGLRVHKLAEKAVWFDEGWNAWMSRFSFGDIVRMVSTDTAPPLHFFVLRMWRQLVGETAFSLRFVSVLAGLLAVAVTIQLGRTIGGRWVGLAAGLLLALSRFHVSWSQEIRMYTLSALFAVLAMWFAVRVWDRGRPTDSVGYVLATTLGLYNHYLAVFVLVAVNVAWLAEIPSFQKMESLKRPLRWVGLQVVAVGLFAPWLWYAIGRMRTWSAESPLSITQFIEITWTTLTIGIPAGIEAFRWLTIPLLLLFLLGLAPLLWRKSWRNITLLLGGLILPGILIFLLSLPGRDFLYTPPVAPRYFMLFVGAYCVLAAWIVLGERGEGRGEREERREKRGAAWQGVRAGLLLPFLLAAVYGLWPYYEGRIEKDNWQSLAATIEAYRQANDAVVLLTDVDWPTFDFYVGGEWWGVPSSWRLDTTQVENYLQPIWQDHEAVWLVQTSDALVSDPDNLMATWLEERANGVLRHDFGDRSLVLYAKTAERTDPLATFADGFEIQYRFDEEISPDPALRVLGYELAVDTFESGDLMHLFLHWKQALPITDAALQVQIADEDGNIRQSVAIAPSTRLRQLVTIPIPPDAPSGTYHFEMEPGDVAFGSFEIRQKVRERITLEDVSYDVPLDVDFEHGITLLGYDLGTVGSEAVPLTLYWQTDRPITTRYKVFTHLLGDTFNNATGNFLWGQQDNEPANGTRPTTLWRSDEVIVDRFQIPVAVNAPEDDYQIEIGLYDPITGARIGVLGADGTVSADHIILTTIEISSK